MIAPIWRDVIAAATKEFTAAVDETGRCPRVIRSSTRGEHWPQHQLSPPAHRRNARPMATGTTISDATVDATSNIADLLPRVGDGDSAAWEEILRRYGMLVSATVRSFRMQDADTLDAVQTTWLRLAENAHQVQHPARLGGWLATTARRECLRILRHITPIPNLFGSSLEAVADPSAGPEQTAIETDSTRSLWKHVDELSPRQRTLLRALFADNARPYAEIASAVGIPPGAIGPTRTRALQQLRDRLDKHKPGDEAWR